VTEAAHRGSPAPSGSSGAAVANRHD